jgi:predicted XRE-type DNA-binding protein
VFKDLGLPDAEELDIKSDLAILIGRRIKRLGLTQIKAAEVMGLDQPKVSALVRGHLEKFSRDRLCDLLTKLGCDVDIRIRERPPAGSKVSPGKLKLIVS